MNVLIVGGGGREHALAWRTSQGAAASNVFVAPGNAGTAREAALTNVDIAANDIDALLQFATDNNVGLCIVGPEEPLVLGITDRFEAAGIACFGPSAGAAQLEGSKAFMKDFLQRHHIPTARFSAFTDVDAACAFADTLGLPVVIKTDGLAAGKGVIIAHSQDEAHATLRDMLSGDAFGEAGRRVVVEEFLAGEEASFIAMVDGEDILPLATSQDHKTRDDGDVGPNTGGMGAYSPAPVIDAALHDRVMHEVMLPTVRGMAADGHRYRGFLYAGLMIDATGTPKVLEFNCRFGDPETQPIMLRLQSDLAALCRAACAGELGAHTAQWDPRPALGVVMAAGGYPADYAKGKVINGLDEVADDTAHKVFHAGTATASDGSIVTSGGRVLCATALGTTIAEAQKAAYEMIDTLEFDAAHCRRDIGHRALNRD
ncbi:MAG: phosphoribosylamine--glycine ligase [Gammaproteobacteria bacterium]